MRGGFANVVLRKNSVKIQTSLRGPRTSVLMPLIYQGHYSEPEEKAGSLCYMFKQQLSCAVAQRAWLAENTATRISVARCRPEILITHIYYLCSDSLVIQLIG